jgi:hypothetical protein
MFYNISAMSSNLNSGTLEKKERRKGGMEGGRQGRKTREGKKCILFLDRKFED